MRERRAEEHEARQTSGALDLVVYVVQPTTRRHSMQLPRPPRLRFRRCITALQERLVAPSRNAWLHSRFLRTGLRTHVSVLRPVDVLRLVAELSLKQRNPRDTQPPLARPNPSGLARPTGQNLALRRTKFCGVRWETSEPWT